MTNQSTHPSARSRIAAWLIAFTMCAGVGGITGCEDGTFEDAGEDVDEAVEETQDAIEDAGDEIEDAADGGGVQEGA